MFAAHNFNELYRVSGISFLIEILVGVQRGDFCAPFEYKVKINRWVPNRIESGSAFFPSAQQEKP